MSEIYKSTEWYINLLKDDVNLSERSKTTYLSTIRNSILKKTNENELHNILIDATKYIGIILGGDISDSTRHTSLSIIVSFFNRYTILKEKYANSHNIWVAEYMKITNILNDRKKSNIPSEKHAKGVLEWKKILEKRDEQEYGSMCHLLLSMYTYIPPRRQEDYARLRVYFDPSYDPKKDHNHLHIYSNRYETNYICIKDYKTAKIYDTYIDTNLPYELIDIIITSFQRFPRRMLFVDNNGDDFKDVNRFQLYSNSMLKKIFNNEYITVSSLRHSFATYIRGLNLSMNDHEKLALKMGHSYMKSLEYSYITKQE